MRIENSAAVTRQAPAQTSGSGASTKFAKAESSTRLARRSPSMRPSALKPPAFFNELRPLPPLLKMALPVFKHLRTLSFTLLHFFALPKWQSTCFQSTAHSLTKTTGGGGAALQEKLEMSAGTAPHDPLRSENTIRMNTYVKSRRNSSGINTYKFAGLKVAQRSERGVPGKGSPRGKQVQHLQKNRGVGVPP